MALIKCQECRSEVSSFAEACLNCGAKVPHAKWWLWIPLGLFAAFMGFGMIVGSSPEAQQRSRERAIIEMCWDDFEDRRMVLTFTQRDFLSTTCRQLEAEYRKKWGREP